MRIWNGPSRSTCGGDTCCMDATDKELREERAGVEHLFAKR